MYVYGVEVRDGMGLIKRLHRTGGLCLAMKLLAARCLSPRQVNQKVILKGNWIALDK
jgi:hypothetical protein